MTLDTTLIIYAKICIIVDFSSDSIKVHLEEYFVKSQKAFDGQFDESLYLLCIQCFEVIAT